MKPANSAGVLLAGSIPCTRSPATTSGFFAASATTAFSCVTVVAGVGTVVKAEDGNGGQSR